MPVTYAYHSEILLIEAIGGDYSPEDLPRTFVAALGDPAATMPVALLLDVTRSTVLATRRPDQIRYVAEFLKPYAERIGRRCAVVASEDVHFGLARMGSVFAEGVGVEAQVFRTMDEAVEWLKPAKRTGTGGAAQ